MLYHLPRYALVLLLSRGDVGVEACRPLCDLSVPHREGACKKTHILKLGRTGKFALNVVDNLVVVHHQDTEVGAVGSGLRGTRWVAQRSCENEQSLLNTDEKVLSMLKVFR